MIIAYVLQCVIAGFRGRQMTRHAFDPCLTSGIDPFIVYSADVIDSHQSCVAGGADALPLTDSRAVIIFIPVRLGGEKTNPEYFSFVKVGKTIALTLVG